MLSQISDDNKTTVNITFKVDKEIYKKVKGIEYPVDTIGFEHTIPNDKLKEILPKLLEQVEEFRIKKLK